MIEAVRKNQKCSKYISRISKRTLAGGWEDEDKWESVHSDMIDFSIKIEKSFIS